MINFEVIDILINLNENENILKILYIFYWNIYKKWIKYCLIIKIKYLQNDLKYYDYRYDIIDR